MSSEVAIRVDGLGKCYHIYDKQRDRLKQFILPKINRVVGQSPKQYFREFWALKDVCFEVRKGETVGIIGRNGSGKSTLLQIICGTLGASSGNVQVYGRIAALLELGSGFNPEFTGRENVYLNGAVLGLTKGDIDARFDAIAEFADIGGFIEQPVKSYSSGMMVRLAFAVIAHVDADILVIDEALAVGDVFFQQKCMRFLRSFQDKRGTVLFVSHDTGSVLSLCDKAVLLMPNAAAMHLGDADTICKLYLECQYADPLRQMAFGSSVAVEKKDGLEKNVVPVDVDQYQHSYDGEMMVDTVYSISALRPDAEGFGNGGATIIDAGFLGKGGEVESIINGDQRVQFFIRVLAYKNIKYPAFGFMIKNSLGEYVYAEGTDMHFRRYDIDLEKGDVSTAIFEFTMPHLIRGRYLVNVAFAEGIGDSHVQHCWLHDAIRMDVIGGRLVHGYSGMNNMAMSIQVGS